MAPPLRSARARGGCGPTICAGAAALTAAHPGVARCVARPPVAWQTCSWRHPRSRPSALWVCGGRSAYVSFRHLGERPGRSAYATSPNAAPPRPRRATSRDGRSPPAVDTDAMAILLSTFPMESGKSFTWHSHDRHQLAWADAGVLTVIAETHTWVLPPTRALWIPAGVVHETVAAEKA